MSFREPNTIDGTIQATFSAEDTNRLKNVCRIKDVKIQDYIRNCVYDALLIDESSIPELMTREQLIELVKKQTQQTDSQASGGLLTTPVVPQESKPCDEFDSSGKDEVFVSLQELADISGLPYSRVYELAKENKIPSLPRIKNGRFYFNKKVALNALNRLCGKYESNDK